MGGTAIIIAMWVGYLVAVGIEWIGGGGGPTASALLLLYLTTGMGLVGFLDDFIKIRKQRNLGPEQADEVPRPDVRRDHLRRRRAVLQQRRQPDARPRPRCPTPGT